MSKTSRRPSLTSSEAPQRFSGRRGDGAWKGQTGIIRDQIIVVEVMAEAVEPEWWRIFRTELEIRLDQEEIVIRSHEIKRL